LNAADNRMMLTHLQQASPSRTALISDHHGRMQLESSFSWSNENTTMRSIIFEYRPRYVPCLSWQECVGHNPTPEIRSILTSLKFPSHADIKCSHLLTLWSLQAAVFPLLNQSLSRQPQILLLRLHDMTVIKQSTLTATQLNNRYSLSSLPH